MSVYQNEGVAGMLRLAAGSLSDLAGPRGLPEAVQTPADSYPGSTTGNVLYDLGVALSLAVGDFAAETSATAALLEEPATSPGSRVRNAEVGLGRHGPGEQGPA